MIDEARAVSWPLPPDEDARLADLHALKVLDTPSEQPFDGIAEIAAALFDAPYAVLGFIDEDRHWFKARHGTDLRETCRSIAFCRFTILSAQTYVIEDMTRDPRFIDHPLVVGAPHVRFYAGAPLVTYEGYCVGTLCVLDVKPRTPALEQIRLLERLAGQAIEALESRRLLRLFAENLPDSAVVSSDPSALAWESASSEEK